MFVIERGSHPKVTHGQLQQVIIDYDNAGNIIAGVVQYQEGFVMDDVFQSLGSNQMRFGVEMNDWVKTNLVDNQAKSIETWLENEKALAPVRLKIVEEIKPLDPLNEIRKKS